MPRLDYKAPGVYIEEINRGSRPIEGVSTNVAGFVGFTEDIRNGAELFKPMLVTNWSQYLNYFGSPNSDGYTEFNAYLPFAVNGFFLNGGGRCWICSVGTHLPGEQPTSAQTGLEISTRGGNRPSLRFSFKNIRENLPALAPLTIEIQDSTPKAPPSDSDAPQQPPENTQEFFSISVREGDRIIERFDNLTMNPEVDSQVGDYVVTQIEESQMLQVEDISRVGRALARRPATGAFQLHLPQAVSRPENLTRDLRGSQDDKTGVQGMFEIDEINILACPDLMKIYQEGLMSLDQVHDIIGLQIGLCEGSMNGNVPNPPNRMVVLDTPPDKLKPQDVVQWLEDSKLRSMFAALYYPWIRVTNPKDGQTISVPPSGHIMGVWSHNDESRGVYKAPANEVPRGVIDLAYDTNFREQELLNPLGINCIRKFPNRGIRIWGARTLVEPDMTEWRYINVRRLISYIEKSIEIGTQWVVFEPNDEDLWARVSRVVTNFLERLWREGALFGASPEEAFYVKCDAELNTPETMMLGRLYVEIGVCPVRPVEFVVFRIAQWNSSDGA